MKNINFSIGICAFTFALLFSFKINATDWLITNSGNYKLGYDILSSGDTNGTIRIKSSYVNLDLNGFFIKQTTSTANCTGIVVDPGFTDVTIKNGTISGFTKNGISIGSNCNKVNINNLIIENCTTSGVSGAGITVASGCSNVSIDSILINSCTATGISFSSLADSVISNCRLISCFLGVAANLIDISSSNRIMVSNISINNCTSSSNLSAINLNSVSYSIFKDINIEGCTASFSNFSAMNLSTITSCKFSSCNFIFNSGTNVYGINCSGSVANTQFEQISISNSAPITSSWGLYVASTFTGNIINQLKVLGTIVGNANFSGIDFANAAGASYNVFSDCIINRNAGNTNSYGIINEGGNPYNTFLRCVVSYNTSLGTTYGLNGTISNWVIQDCIFEQNNGSTDANSFGTSITTTNSLFSRNVAFANGPTNPLIQNQLSGVPIGSMTTPGGGGAGAASVRLASATSPWTNLRITN